MIEHPAFPNILMHSDQELSDTLGARIACRQTIHEWPLSCVQEVMLEDGKRLIYKAQLPPTVEPDFYEHAISGLLPCHRNLGKLGRCHTMAIEFIDAPLLRDIGCTASTLVVHGKRLIERIKEIGGNPPAYLDIGSFDAWRGTAKYTIGNLQTLIANGRFRKIELSTVDRLLRWSGSDAIQDAVERSASVIHGDLKADQVFVTADGYRVIDWQRPIVAPAEVDLVSLLINQRIAPHAFVDRAIIDLFWFLRLCWAVEAQFALFSEARWPIFNRWALEAIENILGG